MRITLDELLTVTDISEDALKSMRRRGQIALAFSRNDAYRSLWYLPVDAVAMLLTMTLAKVYGASIAAQIVRMFGDVWLTVVAQAESDVSVDALFAVSDLIREADGRRAHLARGARDAIPEAIAAELARSPEGKGYVAERINLVNVSHIIRRIRVTAARHGIDLTSPLMLAPASEEFQELMQRYARQENGIVEARARRKREAIARRVGEQVRARLAGGRTSFRGRRAHSLPAA
ncbi:MAG: hypothetical protein ACJ8EL_20275 [Rhizomicrobium sp.]